MVQLVWFSVVFAVTVTCASALGITQDNVPRFDEKDMDVEQLKQSVLRLSKILIEQDKKINELTKHKENIIEDNASFQESITKELLEEIDVLKNKVSELESKMTLMEGKTPHNEESSESKSAKISTEQTSSNSELAKRHQETPGIAFFASLTNHLENIGAGQYIVFDNIFTNEGGAYSKDHGSFTAPVPGIYVFSLTLLSYQDQAAHFRVLHNGAILVHIWPDGRGDGDYDTAAATVIIVLTAGDVVVIDSQWAKQNLYGDHYSFFSGFLFKAL